MSTLFEHTDLLSRLKTSEQSVLKSDPAKLRHMQKHRRHDDCTHTGLSLGGGLS